MDNKPAPSLPPQPPLPPVLAIAGPTASGKTAAALKLAQVMEIEIISVDSALVYRGMDIGSAKPSRAELAAVPHHLIDIIEPEQAYSVAQFRTDCLRLIDDIAQRGKLPVLVGGTMLYFKALIDGLDDLPATPPQLRQQLEQELGEQGLPALYARLQQCDPDSATRLKPNDVQRITRALEVTLLTGRPFSSLLTGKRPAALPFALHLFSLEPGERSGLHQRIATRFDAMLKDDQLIDEVRHLRQSHPALHANLPSMRCVGYRQAWAFLDGVIDRATLRETGIIATRQLAKRQLTWLRAMPERQVIDCLAEEARWQLLEKAKAILAQYQNGLD